MAIHGCFVLGTARVKALLGWLKKKEPLFISCDLSLLQM